MAAGASRRPSPAPARRAVSAAPRRPVRIAIACQGGGSHTAFTAGVLKSVLRRKAVLTAQDYRIGGLSGTSGGAICALLAWYGLLTDDWDGGIRRLDAFWTDNSADTPRDALLNASLTWTARLRDVLTLPELSPYFYPPWAEFRLRSMLEALVDFEKIPALVRPDSPMLLVAAVNTLSGRFKVFRGKRVTVDAILASTAIPNLFRAACIRNLPYWDGLFSQNPPVRNFLDGVDPEAKPHELWVIQINPLKRRSVPTLVGDILDRRNELAGNLPLQQELYFIKRINAFIRSGKLRDPRYHPVEVRVIALEKDLPLETKLDRSPPFIERMMRHGEDKGDEFLDRLLRKAPMPPHAGRLH